MPALLFMRAPFLGSASMGERAGQPPLSSPLLLCLSRLLISTRGQPSHHSGMVTHRNSHRSASVEVFLGHYVPQVPLALSECLGPEAPADHARKQSLGGKPCISNVPGVPFVFGLESCFLWSCMTWELCWGKRGQKCIPAGQRVPCTQFSV